MSFWIQDALAATDTPTSATMAGHQSLSSLIFIGIFVLFFYLAVWLPQSRRMKAQRQLLSSLNVGDEVITTSGIYGKITALEDNLVHLQINESSEIRLQKTAISTIIPKGSFANTTAVSR